MTSIRHAEPRAGELALGPPAASVEVWEQKFREDLAADVAFESRLLPKELWTVLVIGVLVALREVLL